MLGRDVVKIIVTNNNCDQVHNATVQGCQQT